MLDDGRQRLGQVGKAVIGGGGPMGAVWGGKSKFNHF